MPAARRAPTTPQSSLVGSVLDAALVALRRRPAGVRRGRGRAAARRGRRGGAPAAPRGSRCWIRRRARGRSCWAPWSASRSSRAEPAARRSAAGSWSAICSGWIAIPRRCGSPSFGSGSRWSRATRPKDPTSVQPLPEPRLPHPPGRLAVRPGGQRASATSRVRWPPSSLGCGGQVVVASGPDKRRLVRELTGLEARVAERTLDELEERRRASPRRGIGPAPESGTCSDGRAVSIEVWPRSCRSAAPRCIASARLRRGVVRGRAVPWFHYQVQFADVFAAGGFDLVVGNPPWLRAEAMEPELRARLAARYRWWRRGPGTWGSRPDLAVAFLERSVQLTRAGGVVAMLVPAKIARATYGAEARHALATTTTLIALADLTGRPEAAFDATVYPLALRRPTHASAVRSPGPHPARGGRSDRPAGRPRRRWAMDPDRRPAAGLSRRPQGRASADRRRHPVPARREDRRQPGVPRPAAGRWSVDTVGGQGTGPMRIHGPCPPPAPLDPRLRWLAAARAAAGSRSLPGPASRRAASEGGSRRRAAVVAVPDPRRNSTPPCRLGRRGALALGRRAHGPRGREAGAAQQLLRRARPRRGTAWRLAAWLNTTWLRAAARTSALPAAGGYARFNATIVGALPLPTAVLTDSRLDRLAREGRLGAPVQDELDDLAAEHLGLARRARTLLRRVAAERPEHRG